MTGNKLQITRFFAHKTCYIEPNGKFLYSHGVRKCISCFSNMLCCYVHIFFSILELCLHNVLGHSAVDVI